MHHSAPGRRGRSSMLAASSRRTPALLLLLLIAAAGELRLANAAGGSPPTPTSKAAADQPLQEERIIKTPHGEARIGHSATRRELRAGPCTANLTGAPVVVSWRTVNGAEMLNYATTIPALPDQSHILFTYTSPNGDGFSMLNKMAADGAFTVQYTVNRDSPSLLTTGTFTSSAFAGLKLTNVASSNSTLQSVQLVNDTVTVQYASGWNNTSPTDNFVLDLSFQLVPFCCADASTLEPCCLNATTIAPAGAICRPRSHPCDAIERCDGNQTTCPADANEPFGTVCAWFDPRHNHWVLNQMSEAASPSARRDVSEQEALDRLAATAAERHYRHKRCLGHCRLGECVKPHRAHECCRSHHADSAEDYAAQQQDNSAAAFAHTEGGRWHCWD